MNLSKNLLLIRQLKQICISEITKRIKEKNISATPVSILPRDWAQLLVPLGEGK